MGRSELARKIGYRFFAHIDEFQNFGTDAFASLLSEARNFAAHFCLANQFIEQLDPAVRAAVLGNAGALILFASQRPMRSCWSQSTHCQPAN